VKEIPGYLLLKRKLKRNRNTIIIQNHGLISKFLIGSYSILSKAFVRISSSQLYMFTKKDFKFSEVKKFFISSIFLNFIFYLVICKFVILKKV
jgi:hypothetical protein